MSRKIAVMNLKGGVAKTTTAITLASALTKLGYKALLIDTDSQCNASNTYRAKIENTYTMYDLIATDTDVEDCIQTTEVGDIIASDHLLVNAERLFPDGVERPYLLKNRMEKYKDNYDFIIVDTPSAMCTVNSNVLTYVDEIVIPMPTEKYALDGIEQLQDVIENVRKYTNHNLKVTGILVVKYAKHRPFARRYNDMIMKYAESINTKVFDTHIRECTSTVKSQDAGKIVLDYDKNCTTSKDYMEFAQEIIERGR